MLKKFDFENTPIVDIVNDILADAAKRGASDIHFDPFEDYLLIRIRIDGDLYDYTKVPNNIRDYLLTRVKTIAKMNITETRRPQDGAIKTTIQGLDLDLRVSSLPVNKGEKIVIRILDYSLSMAGLGELGFSEENYKKLIEMISVPNGIILVTGATGTGKSTTVYSILQYLNRSNINLITVEDPIEMDIKGVNQVQVNPQIDLTFASALRSILRQDPNIIMIGEIRDTETAQIAVRASITGHLVLSTVHTNNSLNTIERLIDMNVPRYLLAAALEGIISQKLARKLCPHCKTLRKATTYEKEIIKTITGKSVKEIYDVEGCEHCHDGYAGRTAIQEVLKIDQSIRDALNNNVSKEELRDMVYGSGVVSLLEDGLNKVVEGETTFNEIMTLIELDDEDKFADNVKLKEAVAKAKIAKQEAERAAAEEKNRLAVEEKEEETVVDNSFNIENEEENNEINDFDSEIASETSEFNEPQEEVSEQIDEENNFNFESENNDEFENQENDNTETVNLESEDTTFESETNEFSEPKTEEINSESDETDDNIETLSL